MLSAAGAAIGLTQHEPVARPRATPARSGIVGGIVLLAILLIAYYAGGYVAGRMSRFDGPRQGLGVWLIGLIVTVVLAVAGVLLGAKYNVLSQLNLPRIPVDEGSLTTGGLIALVAIVVGTLLASMAGGKQGTHYHRKIDRTGVIEHEHHAEGRSCSSSAGRTSTTRERRQDRHDRGDLPRRADPASPSGRW